MTLDVSKRCLNAAWTVVWMHLNTLKYSMYFTDILDSVIAAYNSPYLVMPNTWNKGKSAPTPQIVNNHLQLDLRSNKVL